MYRWSGAATLLLLLIYVSPGASQVRPSIDPGLRSLLRDEVRRDLEAAPAQGARADRRLAPLGGTLAFERTATGAAPRVGILVRIRPPIDAGLARLRAAGAEIGSVAGDVVTARVPLDAIGRLAGAYEIERIEAARTLEVVHDSSIAAIRADQVRHNEDGVWYGSAGHGVLIGVYDTGIDDRHDDFRDPSGGTRILGLWDQTGAAAPPPGFDYGRFCDRAALDATTCGQRDRAGHGTHVAGSAAGDGSSGDTPYRYAGVAPAADLLVVKGGDTGFATDRIVDGVNWIFQTAAALDRPVVVNLSLGGQFGPRDGTTLFERALDNLAGPGRVIVVSAGNEGANGNTTPAVRRDLFHAMAVPTPGSTQEFRIDIPTYTQLNGSCNDFAVIELWYAGEDSIDLTVVRPNASSVTAVHGDSAVVSDPNGGIVIYNATEGSDPQNGDHEALVVIDDCGSSGPPEDGRWTIRATPAAATSGRPLHLWISSSQFGSAFEPARGTSGNFDNGYAVSAPGTARGVVTVGAYVTRLCWPSAIGEICYTQREQAGDIARFSSGGPTRDGRLKPEIAAPGMAILSARSRDASFSSAQLTADGAHAALQGTSMAAPHVTGGIALMLQHAPALTADEVRQLLARTAIRDGFTSNDYTGTGPSPEGLNNQWGHGKLDVRAAIAELADPASVAGVVVSPASDTLPVGATLQLEAAAFNAVGDPIATAVTWSSSDPAIASVDADGLVRAESLGVAIVSASAGGRTGTASITVQSPVATIAISPADAILVAGEARQFTAATFDASGGELTGRPIAWSSADTMVAQVSATGQVRSVAPGTTTVVAISEGHADSARIDVLAPATLVVAAEAVDGAGTVSSRRDERVALLRLHLRADGPEGIRVLELGFQVAGEDPDAQLLLIHDLDRDAAIGPDEPVVASTGGAFRSGGPRSVSLPVTSFEIAESDSASMILALEFGGGAPNGTSFRASYDPTRTRSIGLRSGSRDRIEGVGAPVASETFETSVLRPGEIFALSENPVRSAEVIFNFSERPRLAAVYTLTGKRVADLLARMTGDGRVVWDLTNDRGHRVAAGVYLVIFDVGGEVVRRKLIVVRPATAGEE